MAVFYKYQYTNKRKIIHPWKGQKEKEREWQKDRMIERQNDKKTESPCREAWLLKMNDNINGDLKWSETNAPTNFK